MSLPLTLRGPWRFQMVGLRWRGSGQVELRAALGGSWTRWLPGSQESPAWVGAADRVQLRRSGAGPVTDLHLAFITSPPVTAAGRAAGDRRPGRPSSPVRVGCGRVAAAAGRRCTHRPLKMVFVHHTDTASVYPCSDSARIVRGIYAYHVLSNGWNDIGYNFLIDRCGHVFEGRYGGVTRPVVGAHARGFNTGSSGIAMIGTFTSTPPTRAASAIATGADRLAPSTWLTSIPTSKVLMTTATGNERFPPGTRLWLRAVSGHPRYRRHVLPGHGALPPAAPDRRLGAAHRATQDLQPPRQGVAQAVGPGRGRPGPFPRALSQAADWTLTVHGPGRRCSNP